MKKLLQITLIGLCALSSNLQADETKPLVYINKNIGFNVDDYKYDQPSFPCDIDKNLVELIISQGDKSDINMESVGTADKIKNGTIPVVLIDIEKLVLGEDHKYGETGISNLPKIQITAGILKGEDLQTAKHTCAIATLNNPIFSTDIITDNRAPVAKCEAVNKCLKDISKDVVEWLKPQVN